VSYTVSHSRSASGLRSVSVAPTGSGSAAPASNLAPQPSQAFGTSKRSKSLAAAYKLELASILKISPHLMNQERKVPLTLAYQRYKACNKAMYPDMVEWLEDGEDRPSSVDVWGLQKTSYSFSDFKKWLHEQKSSLAADVEEKMDKKEKERRKRRKRGKILKNIVLQRRVLQRVPPEKRRKLVKGNRPKVEILRMRTVMQGRIKKGSRRPKEATRMQRRIRSK
jgi:hypothetical protein